MYDVLIVDDEPWALLDIQKTFKFEEAGFNVVGAFGSSIEALGQILELRPHVVFTDIKMPVLSGIDLLKEVKNNEVDSEFIIVSGHTDFEYTKEAIQLCAFDYCSKPLNRNEATKLLDNLKLFLDKKYKVKTDSYISKYEGEEQKLEKCEEKIDHDPKNTQVNKSFKKMLDYIEYNYQKKLQLNDLGKMFYLNPNYCCNLFNKTIGKSFSQYLTEIRMKKSIDLLQDFELSLPEVAGMVGFEEYFYFSKVFKKYYNISPRKYREQLKERKQEDIIEV